MRITGRILIACAAALAAFAVAMPRGNPGTMSAFAQDANAVVTTERAATLTIPRPSDPASVFLDLWVNAYTPPTRGAVEAVVSVGPADRRAPVEVGRFSVFPSEPFTASEGRKQRAYRFNAGAALEALKAGDDALTVHIEMISLIDKVSAAGAKLTISKVAFSSRP
jgi:hypothetical protein